MTASERSKTDTKEVRTRVSWGVFGASAAAILAFAMWAVLAPDVVSTTIGVVVEWASNGFGWLYVLLTTACVLFVIFVGLSRFGTIRLGPKNSKPEYGLFSWGAMLFAAGIATDLMFFSVSEAVTQYLDPPVGQGGTIAAARQASVWTLFHYGLNGWGTYTLMGLALAYFTFRRNLPLSIRSTLYPLFGKRVNGPIGYSVDLAAILATVFGIAATLGLGVVFLNYGLTVLFDIPEGLPAQAALLALAVVAAGVSAVSGVDKGIRLLSQLGVMLSICLLAFILLAGDTVLLLKGLVLNVGEYLSGFLSLSTETFAFDGQTEWMNSWTLFFWAWWIAWAAFVGLFLARISRGRTIREFVIGTLTIPIMYIVLWTSLLGNSAVSLVRGGDTALGAAATDQPAHSLYRLLSHYPAFPFIAGVTTFIGLLLYVTSADSGALVLARISSSQSVTRGDGPVAIRIFWTLTIGILTLAVLAVGGIAALQSSTIIFGIPFAVVLILVMCSLYTALRAESADAKLRNGRPTVLPSERPIASVTESAAPVNRLFRALGRSANVPASERSLMFLTQTALPAMKEMCEELRQIDVEATVTSNIGRGGTGSAILLVPPVDGSILRYEVTTQEPETNAHGEPVKAEHESCCWLTVHTADGSQRYDVTNYTYGQILDDISDQYESALVRVADGTEPIVTDPTRK